MSIINVLYTCNFWKKFNYTNFLYFLCHFLRSFLCSYNNVAVSNFLKFWYSSVNIRMQNKGGLHYCSYFLHCTNFEIFIYINLSVDCLMVKFWAQLTPLEAHILPWMATNKATLYSDPEYCVLSCLWLCFGFYFVICPRYNYDPVYDRCVTCRCNLRFDIVVQHLHIAS